MRNEISIFKHTHPAATAVQSRSNEMILGGGHGSTTALVASVFHEQCRAILAKTALDNLGALSAFEEHLISIAPNGESQYRKIIEAYAAGSAMKIWRW